MGIIKNFFAFVIGICMILVFYYYVSIPIIPCLSIHAIALLFENNSTKSRIAFIVIGTIFGMICYGTNAILSIIYYPKDLTIIGIILEFINVYAFFTAAFTLIYGMLKFKH